MQAKQVGGHGCWRRVLMNPDLLSIDHERGSIVFARIGRAAPLLTSRIPCLISSTLNPGVMKRDVFAWAILVFANSGFTTVVVTAVCSVYPVSAIASEPSVDSTA